MALTVFVVVQDGAVTYRGTRADCLTVVDVTGGIVKRVSLFQLFV